VLRGRGSLLFLPGTTTTTLATTPVLVREVGAAWPGGAHVLAGHDAEGGLPGEDVALGTHHPAADPYSTIYGWPSQPNEASMGTPKSFSSPLDAARTVTFRLKVLPLVVGRQAGKP